MCEWVDNNVVDDRIEHPDYPLYTLTTGEAQQVAQRILNRPLTAEELQTVEHGIEFDDIQEIEVIIRDQIA